jgi:hypothetical protein
MVITRIARAATLYARYLRLGISTLALPLLWACNSLPLIEAKPIPQEQNDQYFNLNPKRDIDLLFMIDDSPSMGDKQENLARNFPGLIDELKQIPGGLPNVHIGIVSSDLGAGPKQFFQCTPGGDRGVFKVKPGCGLDPSSRFMVSSNNGTMNNFTGDISQVFSCLALVGENGCGEEHQLQAVRVGLYESVTPANEGFLRDDAYLAIVIVTDEDDCSAPVDTDLFLADIPGQSTSLRCSLEGHLCMGMKPPAATFTAPLSSCTPVDKGKLISVSEMVDSVKALKKVPGKIIVSAISGWSSKPDAQYRYGVPPGESRVDYLPICVSAAKNSRGQPWTATAALRVKAFVDAFGADGDFFDICADDYRPAMRDIGKKLAIIVGRTCIDAPVADTKPDPGIQPDCQVTDHIPSASAPGGFEDVALPPCSSGNRANGACWDLAPDGVCPVSGLKVVVDRGGAMAPPDSQMLVKCLTCAKPGDPRCAR